MSCWRAYTVRILQNCYLVCSNFEYFVPESVGGVLKGLHHQRLAWMQCELQTWSSRGWTHVRIRCTVGGTRSSFVGRVAQLNQGWTGGPRAKPAVSMQASRLAGTAHGPMGSSQSVCCRAVLGVFSPKVLTAWERGDLLRNSRPRQCSRRECFGSESALGMALGIILGCRRQRLFYMLRDRTSVRTLRMCDILTGPRGTRT